MSEWNNALNAALGVLETQWGAEHEDDPFAFPITVVSW